MENSENLLVIIALGFAVIGPLGLLVILYTIMVKQAKKTIRQVTKSRLDLDPPPAYLGLAAQIEKDMFKPDRSKKTKKKRKKNGTVSSR